MAIRENYVKSWEALILKPHNPITFVQPPQQHTHKHTSTHTLAHLGHACVAWPREVNWIV